MDEDEQAVLLTVTGGLAGADLAELEDAFIEVVEEAGVGECDGHEQSLSTGDVVFYFYGSSADAIAIALAPMLASRSWPAGSRFVKRYGGPDSSEEEVALGR